MARCRPVRESIAGCYDAAKQAGIPTKELRAVIKERKFLKQIEANRSRLEDDQQETLDQIKHALGMIADLPLGDAALKRSAAVDSLTGDEPGEFEDGTEAEDEFEAAGRANAAKLSAGIKPTVN
jgi:hypothetical protein